MRLSRERLTVLADEVGFGGHVGGPATRDEERAMARELLELREQRDDAVRRCDAMAKEIVGDGAELPTDFDRRYGELWSKVLCARAEAARLREALERVENMGADGYSEEGCPVCLTWPDRPEPSIHVRASGVEKGRVWHYEDCWIGQALKVTDATSEKS